MSVASVLDELLDPLSGSLSAESGRRVMDRDVGTSVQFRISVLAELANGGKLTDDQRAEYEVLMGAVDSIDPRVESEGAERAFVQALVNRRRSAPSGFRLRVLLLALVPRYGLLPLR